MNAKQIYKQLRKKEWKAKNAWDYAVTKSKFYDRDDVRLLIEPDQSYSMKDLKGDMFDPKINKDVKPEILAKQEKDFEERVSQQGVWGIVGQYKCPCCGEWKSTDSVWGFVGDDWEESGYDEDIMNNTMEEADAHKKVSCEES